MINLDRLHRFRQVHEHEFRNSYINFIILGGFRLSTKLDHLRVGDVFPAFLATSRGIPMRKSRFNEREIVSVLQEYDAGASVTDLCRKHGISSTTLYKWMSRYGGMGRSELRRQRSCSPIIRSSIAFWPTRCWTTPV